MEYLAPQSHIVTVRFAHAAMVVVGLFAELPPLPMQGLAARFDHVGVCCRHERRCRTRRIGRAAVGWRWLTQ